MTKRTVIPTDDVRLFLESALESALRIADLRERVTSLNAAATKVTTRLSAVPGGGGSDKEKILLSLADARDELNKQIVSEYDNSIKVGKFIDSLQCSNAARAVMRRRYLHYESWVQILMWMSRNNLNYSERSVYRLHGEGIDAARKQWEQMRSEAQNDAVAP